MFSVENITYSYRTDDNPITYQYNMEIGPGQIAGVLGPSGSGKSTLLDIISGFLPPTAGDIMLNEKSILDLSPRSRPVSILFQKHNLFEHLNTIQNVMIGIRGEIRGDKSETARVDEILARLHIHDQRDKKITDLSGGQQQRVALARVLIRNKPILLLDEPFTGLDNDTKSDILAVVRDITTEYALHTIMVTHDNNDCDAIANSVYTMKNRKLIRML